MREDDGDGALTIGAAAPLDAAWRALVRRHPELEDVWLRFASLPIRNAGTMGGNVANGSPIGDSAPVLIALDAEIVLRRGERRRSLPLADFYLGYMKNRLEAGEFVEAIRVPAPPAGLQLRCHKISKRYDCDISAVCAGLAVALDEAGVVRHVRLAWGGMAATVQRAAGAEAALAGTALGRVRAACRAGRAGGRLHPADRHACQRRLPAAGRAEPAGALLAGDAAGRRAACRGAERVEHDDARRRLTPAGACSSAGPTSPHESRPHDRADRLPFPIERGRP